MEPEEERAPVWEQEVAAEEWAPVWEREAEVWESRAFAESEWVWAPELAAVAAPEPEAA